MSDLIEKVAREIVYICHQTGDPDRLWPTYKSDAAEIIKAIEAAGYRIVPVEPTKTMLDAVENIDESWDNWNATYTAFLSAAPRHGGKDGV